ncbi:MAG: helix-turn-helix domain-containing protein [Bacteroidales bacterium]|nr:helix-turn-helix domain-containing protein [Bacteroidales bacterium]
MQNRSDIAVPGVGEIIRQRLAEMGISQTELAARVGEHYQTISAIINGKREATIALSVRIDEVLDFSPGTVALAQTRHQISKELKECQAENMREKRQAILARIKANGGFWSYDGIPDRLDDDAVIEAALVHLDLEDLPLLLGLWSKAHIKRVWKDRLVSQGKRMNILNYILAVKFFGIPNPDLYLSRHALAY